MASSNSGAEWDSFTGRPLAFFTVPSWQRCYQLLGGWDLNYLNLFPCTISIGSDEQCNFFTSYACSDPCTWWRVEKSWGGYCEGFQQEKLINWETWAHWLVQELLIPWLNWLVNKINVTVIMILIIEKEWMTVFNMLHPQFALRFC